MRYKEQGFPMYALEISHDTEEAAFNKTVCSVPTNQVHANSKIISSNVIYKIKVNEGQFLKPKARIALHGNEDSCRFELKSDFAMCSPTGVRILLSYVSLHGWKLTKVDVASAFLQAGPAARDVYVIPPVESQDRGKTLWLLLAAAYGLINSNAKWKMQSDELLFQLGFQTVPLMPQLLMKKKNGYISVLLEKIVNDILIASEPTDTKIIVTKIDGTFKLGTVASSPGPLKLFGLNIHPHEDLSISVDADEKLDNLELLPISRIRGRPVDEPLNIIEKKGFRFA